MLDALRGVAAVGVVIFHAQTWFGGGYLFLHGDLAVDFFFVLSGFVIEHAYGHRLALPRGGAAIARTRILRLYPLLVFGTVVGIAVYLLRNHALGLPLDRQVIADCLASLIPFPALWRDALFPVDPAVWSLFWELVVNFGFALVLYRMKSPALVVFAVALAAMLIVKSVAAGGLDFGPYRTDWAFGGVRAFYGFIVGMLLLRRVRSYPQAARWSHIWVVIFVIAMLSANPPRGIWSTGYELLVVILVNPMIVLFAARSAPIVPRIEAWSGAMSYPLYVIHAPILLVVGGVLARTHATAYLPKWLIGLMIVVILVGLADALNRWFDVPVRRYLGRRLA